MLSASRRRNKPELAMVAAVAIALLAGNFICATAMGQATFQPLTTFGSNGWLAPGAIPQLTTANEQRGLAVTPNGELALPSRSSGALGNNVWTLSGSTGVVSGSLTPPTGGYPGGTGVTFVINAAGAGSDGAIYTANLVSTGSFRVFKWTGVSDTNPASIVFNSQIPQVNRVGDCFTAYGSGSSAQWAAAGSNSLAGTNSAFTVGTTDASNTQKTYTSVPGTATANNGYRLGLSFMSGTSLLGTQGTDLYSTTFDGTTATVVSGSTGAAYRPIAYLNHNGTPYVATVDTNSSTVALFNLANPATPLLAATGNNTVGTLASNANGTGGIGWGPSLGGDQYLLYAMSTNQGIQGFVVTVPEPSTYAVMGAAFAAIGLVASRKRDSKN